MIEQTSFFNKKVSTLFSFLILIIFSLVLVVIIFNQFNKLSELEKPIPLMISPYNEEIQ